MNILLQSLADVCAQYPLQEKVLIVPSYRAGQELLQSLSLAGVRWINLRLSTIRGEAMNIVLPHFAAQGIEVIPHTAAITIIEQIIANLQSEGKLKYFRDVNLCGDVAEAFAASIHDLRMAGLSSETLDKGAFVSFNKGADLNNILRSYETLLAARHRQDFAGAFRLALDLLNGQNNITKEVMYLLPQRMELTPPEKAFLEKLSGGATILLNCDIPQGLTDFAGGQLDLFRAYGETNEIREVLRRVKDKKIPFDQVQIVYTAGRVYVHTLYTQCQRLNIPITFAEGVPVSLTRPGRLCGGLITWIKSDFNVLVLRELFASGDMRLSKQCYNTGQASTVKAARILRRSGIGWGRDRYVFEEKWLEDEINKILAQLPVPDVSGKVNFSELSAGIKVIVNLWKKAKDELDEVGYRVVVSALEEYASGGTLMLPLSEALERLQIAIGVLSVGQSGPKPGHMHALSYRQAGWLVRPFTYVVGLSTKYFPGSGLQDPILLDNERQRLSEDLTLFSEKPRDNIRWLARMLAGFRGQITMSYASFDVRECRSTAPAAIMLQAYRYITSDETKDYSQLAEFLGTPAGYLTSAGQELDDTDWWISQVYPVSGRAETVDAVLACFPALGQGVVAIASRCASSFGEYDGKILADTSSLDPSVNHDMIMSCSRIEYLARCPFAYFLKYVLRIEPPEEVEYKPAEWLDALNRGRLLHEVFYRFMTELAVIGAMAKYPDHRLRIMEIAEGLISEYKVMIPPPNETVFEWEKEGLLRSCDVFLRIEAGNTVTRPKFFELTFGMGVEGLNKCKAGQVEPVRIDLPGGRYFYLRGQIDRVDEVDAGVYRIWDYKTGSTYGYDDNGFIKQGRQIQHALYAMALEQILSKRGEATVEAAGYLFPTERGEGQAMLRTLDRRGEVREALGYLFDILAGGVFNACDDGNGCTFCEYQTVCEPDQAVEIMKKKLQIDGNTCLLSWKELKKFD